MDRHAQYIRNRTGVEGVSAEPLASGPQLTNSNEVPALESEGFGSLS